jgi:predicted nucleic acid-binding protein
VTRYLLDTNIISDVTKPVPSSWLVDWISKQADEDLFISAMTVAEIWFGIARLPAGKKRKALEQWFEGPESPISLFSGRILSFDAKAGMIWGEIMAAGQKAGQSRSAIDMILAAVAEANDCTLVTDNERHFAGMKYLNPVKSQLK